MLLLWGTLPSFHSSSLRYSILLFLLLVGFLVYSSLIRGWRSFSKYRVIGRIRRGSQSVSYEILLSLVVVRVILFRRRFLRAKNVWGFRRFLLLLWFLCSLAECNRAPFDFREGERELIRGFNVEYGRRGFVLLFLREYGIIIFFSLMRDLFFFNYTGIGVIFLILLILARRVLPRFRYDKLIRLIWKTSLPFVCLFLILLLSL